MSESYDDYRRLVNSINRVADADGPAEIAEILMETIELAGIEGKGEMAAAAILISQYCASQAILHNFRQVIVNIPKRGSAESSESWEAAAGLASDFLNATMEDLWSLRESAGQEEAGWAVAHSLAENLLAEIARSCQDLAAQVPQEGVN